jgi:hypothetical protein
MKSASALVVITTFAFAPSFAYAFGVDLTWFFGGAEASSPTDSAAMADATTLEDAKDAADAGQVADAGRDAADGPCMLPNLLSNGDFSFGSEGWGCFNGDFKALRSAARTGVAGGKACSPYSYFVAGYGFAPTLPAATYAARVWTRASPGELDTIMHFGFKDDTTGVEGSIGATTAKWKCSEFKEALRSATSTLGAAHRVVSKSMMPKCFSCRMAARYRLNASTLRRRLLRMRNGCSLPLRPRPQTPTRPEASASPGKAPDLLKPRSQAPR